MRSTCLLDTPYSGAFDTQVWRLLDTQLWRLLDTPNGWPNLCNGPGAHVGKGVNTNL